MSHHILKHPALQSVLDKADHVDVKSVETNKSLPDFMAGLFNYHPWWLLFLFGVRAVFVRLLGMRQERMSVPKQIRGSEVSFEPGQALSFFTVHDGNPESFHISFAKDRHLIAYMAVVMDPASTNSHRTVHVVTVVRYLHWTGPVYFNVIRPFHHIVVGQMARAAAR